MSTAEVRSTRRTSKAPRGRAGVPGVVVDLSDERLDRNQRSLLEAFVRHLLDSNPDLALGAEDDADAVVSRMFSTLPGTWNDDVGPFHSTANLREWMGVTRQALDQQVKKGVLLCLPLGDGTLAYPDFQFGIDGSPLPRLRDVLDLLDPERADLWGDALWLNTPAASLGTKRGGRPITPAEALRSPRAADVIDLARRIGAALAS